MSPLGAIAGQQPVEEAVVDAPSAPGSFSIISLSSASPADSETNGPVVPPPPVNTPAKIVPNNSQASSPGNTASFEQLLSCFYPLNRIWNFTWTGAPKEAICSDSEAENYEISLESIEVDFKENYIGGGNQSSVFRGRWRAQWIALKKLNRASEVDIKRLCSLDHPNVIKTLGVCTKDIYPCIVMEYCEQGGLFDYLRRTPVMSKSLFFRWSVEVATGMAYLHTLKIVHRDLKSPNILVDNRDTLKICDFGSLYSWDQRSQNKTPAQMASVVMSVVGTSQWMSPEMVKNEPCNEKVDVWSFGVVLWELLTGEVPFDKIAPMAVCFGVGSDQLRLYVPRTAPENVKFLLKICWARKSRNRPSFMCILTHLNNLQAELAEMQENGWSARRELWRREIGEQNAMLHNSGKAGDFNAQKQKEEALVQKRTEELRHAQEIRELYENKRDKLDRIWRQTERFLQQMNAQEKANEKTAAAMNDRLAHNAHWHQLLHEWHAALKEAEGQKKRKQIDIAELAHIVRQAEEARKAAMFLHGVEEEGGGGGNRTEDTSMAKVPQLNLGAQPRNKRSGRPAVLRMTYYDYDENTGHRIGMQQKVFAQGRRREHFGERKRPQHQNLTFSTVYQTRPETGDVGNANLCQHRPDSSTSLSSSDDDELEEGEVLAAPPPPIAHRHRRHHRHRMPSHQHQQNSLNNNNSERHSRIQQQHSLMSSCPSECSSLANVPSNCSVFSRRSADLLHSPVSNQATPKYCVGTLSRDDSAISSAKYCVGTLSRDDSAISSAVPFSPSDRSLQNMANNNGGSHQQQQGITLPNPVPPPLCSNCQCNLALPFSVQQQFFARNSVARASGLSADSGVCQEEEPLAMLPPSLCGVLEENGNLVALEEDGHCKMSCCLAPNTCQCPVKMLTVQRGQTGRWSDQGGVKLMRMREQRNRRQASQIPFNRNSPLRTPSRRNDQMGRRARSKTVEQKKAKAHCSTQNREDGAHVQMREQQHCTGSTGAVPSSHCSTSSSATLGRRQSPLHREMDKARNRRVTKLRQQSSQECHPNHWFSSPELCDSVDQNDSAEESPTINNKEMVSQEMVDEQLKLGPINEMTDSQLTERAMAAEKAMATVMLESSSTMVSSLERSLEMAVAHSDGLSDRETKLKEAKTTFKLTHRRTASNPSNLSHLNQQLPPPSASSSSSADNDGIHHKQHHHPQHQRCESSYESESDEPGEAK